MRIQTSEIPISKAVKNLIAENWNTSNIDDPNQGLLDSEVISKTKQFNFVLRIPYNNRGGTSHMLLNSHIAFKNSNDRVMLSIHCSIIKPAIIFGLLGFLSATVFVLPQVYFNNGNMLIYVFSILALSALYFGIFYSRILRISKRYVDELSQKHL